MKQYRDILLLCALIFASRIPFLFSGYGSEEDAWGLILTARKIDINGVYEVSRMPGHPVQEYLLSLIWNWPSWILNLLTAIVSSAGIGLFMASLKKLGVMHYREAGIALAFVPAVYLNSSNVMDYTWAMAITMLSLILCIRQKPVAAGIVLGLAAGFRITALGMAVPFALLFMMHDNKRDSIRNTVMFWTAAALVAATAFLPPFLTYGPSFFMYYQYFPDPPLLKNIYKATIGAWGTAGFLAMMTALAAAAIAVIKQKPPLKERYLLALCLTVMFMYLYAYYKLPQKSAFVIPAAPFVITFCALMLGKKWLQFVAGAMVISSLFFGINLDDPNRGSDRSALSIPFTSAGSTAVFDVLCGPVPADLSKRKNKIRYAREVSETVLNSGKKTLLIAGWYQNEIEHFLLEKERNDFVTVYYADEKELTNYRDKGYVILHLPEQDLYNDLRYKGAFTSRFSSPFPGELTAEF